MWKRRQGGPEGRKAGEQAGGGKVVEGHLKSEPPLPQFDVKLSSLSQTKALLASQHAEATCRVAGNHHQASLFWPFLSPLALQTPPPLLPGPA